MFYPDKKRNIISWVTLPMVIVAFMAFGPHGSFSPMNIGFYTSIITGGLISLTIDYVLSKVQKE